MSKTKEQAHPKRERKPKKPKLRNKAYKFRISPTKKQIATLEWTLRRCKELYNAALEERREAYRMSGVSVSYVTICSHKAAEAGGIVVKVAPHGTSQACSGCGCIVPKDLGVRWHSCPHCGTELDRDHNAAKNILQRYQQTKGAGSVPQRSRMSRGP